MTKEVRLLIEVVLLAHIRNKLLQLLPSQLQAKDIIFPGTKEMVLKIWRHFDFLYHLINTDSEENGDLSLEVFEKSKEFVEHFCTLGGKRVMYIEARVTPYMHAPSKILQAVHWTGC